MNKVILSGRLTKDVIVNEYGENKVCKNSIAINRKIKGVEETNFFEIDVWNKSAEYLEKYGKKGNKVLIEGELRTSSYMNSMGNNVSKTFIYVSNVEILDSNLPSKQDNDDLNFDSPKPIQKSKITIDDDEEEVLELERMKKLIKDKREGGELRIVPTPSTFSISDDDLPF